MLCNKCDEWYHFLCEGLSEEDEIKYCGTSEVYKCSKCTAQENGDNADLTVAIVTKLNTKKKETETNEENTDVKITKTKQRCMEER